MITIRFKKIEEPSKYDRTASFPDGQKFHNVVEVPVILHTRQQTYPWEKDLYQLPENDLVDIGRVLAELALSSDGVKKFKNLKKERTWTGIQFVESLKAPELTSVPWELIHIDDEFISLNPKTLVRRCLEGYEDCINKITLRSPIRMALISAAPPGLNPLLIEKEQIRFALSIGHLITKGKLEVHEIISCTRGKLSTALQNNWYDILYFTGHGFYRNGMGYVCLEKEENSQGETTDYLSSLDLGRMISEDNIPSLVFLNCCQSATSSYWYDQCRMFRDMGRELLKNGVPDVVATLTPIFDEDSQIFMRVFFESLLSNYAVGKAISKAREELKQRSLNTFYQYIHLSQTVKHPTLDSIETKEEEKSTGHYFVSINHPSFDLNYVNRYHPISQIEESYSSGAKVVIVSGIGGVGKTVLSQMLEKRLLAHYDPKLKVDKTIWLDLREDYSLGGFIRQISNVLASAGDEFAANKLGDMEDVDALIVCRILTKTFGDHVLLTLDNCETLVDERGTPKDHTMFRFIIGLLAHTKGWKALLTTREPFDLTIDNRMLFNTHVHELGSLTYTERVALLESLLMRKSNQINIRNDEKGRIISEVAGNPYELSLFVHALTPLSDIETLIKETHRRTGEYAYLDYYVGKLDKSSLDVLHLLSVFRTPPTKYEIELVAKHHIIFEKVDIRKALENLVSRGLVESRKKCFLVPPVVAFYLAG